MIDPDSIREMNNVEAWIEELCDIFVYNFDTGVQSLDFAYNVLKVPKVLVVPLVVFHVYDPVGNCRMANILADVRRRRNADDRVEHNDRKPPAVRTGVDP